MRHARLIRLSCRVASRSLSSKSSPPLPPDIARLLSMPFEHAAETGAHVINAALAASGSPKMFRQEQSKPSNVKASNDKFKDIGFFWNPYTADSPFLLGRDKFLQHYLVKGKCTRDIVPDSDVEEYVDALLSEGYLTRVAIPGSSARRLYMSVVRIVLHVILNGCQLLEGTQVLGQTLLVLTQPSKRSTLSCRGQAIDPLFIKRLAERVVDDHKDTHHYLQEVGIPMPVIRVLYQDIIALSARLVLDVCLSFRIRCLGHTLSFHVSSDEGVHQAPGWNVDLRSGVFGYFADAAKRQMAREFVEQLMQDDAVIVKELPVALQREVYFRAVLVQLNLAETALNHFRIHVAGMAFRPALISEPLQERSDC